MSNYRDCVKRHLSKNAKVYPLRDALSCRPTIIEVRFAGNRPPDSGRETDGQPHQQRSGRLNPERTLRQAQDKTVSTSCTAQTLLNLQNYPKKRLLSDKIAHSGISRDYYCK